MNEAVYTNYISGENVRDYVNRNKYNTFSVFKKQRRIDVYLTVDLNGINH